MPVHCVRHPATVVSQTHLCDRKPSQEFPCDEVVPIPVAEAGDDVTVCWDNALILDACDSTDLGCPGGLVYEWRDGATVVRAEGPDPTYMPPTRTSGGSTTYTVVVRCASDPGCESSDEVVVTVDLCLAVQFGAYAAAWTEVEVVKGGKVYLITFERGDIKSDLHVIATRADATDKNPRKTGTKISFLPDARIFTDTAFRYETLQHRLRELAYLNPGANIRLIDERVDRAGKLRHDTFHYEDGLLGYVEHLNRSKTVVSPVIRVRRADEKEGSSVDIAMQYTDSPNELLLAFGNNINNPDGGTHVANTREVGAIRVSGYKSKGRINKRIELALD